MNGGFLPAALAGLVLIMGCATKPQGVTIRRPAPPPPEPVEIYQIIDYETKELGEEIPPWVSRYLEEDVQAVEKLPEYENKYVFIGVNSGTNNRLLRQWAENFAPAQDFARLAAARIEARFSRAALAYPDDEYGRFFEMMIRAASDGFYGGAGKEDVFWIQRRFFDADGVTVNREEYDFLILCSMDKSLFQRRVHDILGRIVPDPPPTREQAAAIRRVMNGLFDGF